MFNKVNLVPSETPSFSAPQQLSHRGVRRFGKKLYVVIAVIEIVIIAAAFFIPQGGATIPLNVDYV